MFDVRNVRESVNLAALMEQDMGAPARHEGRWLKWYCPFHADERTPSLGVAGNRWKCFGCGRSGDSIDWLRKREDLSFREACERLSSMKSLSPSKTKTCPQPLRSSSPSAAWQDRARKIVRVCQATLWSEAGSRARAWLDQRGLAGETIRHWRLGFNPGDRTLYGLWVPRGIVIPCLVAGEIWYVKVRRAGSQPKYTQVSGGRTALLGADTLSGHSAAAVTEGEFDAMLLHQEAGDLIGVVTLGSAAARLPDVWVPYLLAIQKLLVAYDADTAGDAGAAMWQALSARTQRLMPLEGQDVTDFYLSGGALRAWVRFALSDVQYSPRAPIRTRGPISSAPWNGQQVSIEDLPELQARFGLRVVGGDPDLDGRPWRPKLYLIESET